MILVLQKDTTSADRNELIKRLEFMGLKAVPSDNGGQPAVAIISGIDEKTKPELFRSLAFVEKVVQLNQQIKLAGKEIKKGRTIVDVKGIRIGGDSLVIMAGPCAIESKESIFEIAEAVASAGASVLRGGAFKPRTSPYDFQGLGEEGLKYLAEAAQKYGLLTISEVMDIEQADIVAEYIDILQIGARNMQNFSLLKAVGKIRKPVMLKRGFSSTYKDLLMAAEYILSEGNHEVMLCERGVRTFETYTRNMLDIAAVPALKQLSHLPVIVDPSHGTGLRSLVVPMSMAAAAAGADGLIVEVHTNPDKAFSDAKQTIDVETFRSLVRFVAAIKNTISYEL